jgi:hypothetical protein
VSTLRQALAVAADLRDRAGSVRRPVLRPVADAP